MLTVPKYKMSMEVVLAFLQCRDGIAIRLDANDSSKHRIICVPQKLRLIYKHRAVFLRGLLGSWY